VLGTISRIAVQAALDALDRDGISTAPVLRASGLAPTALASVDARVPFEHAMLVWEHAARAADDPSFGLHTAATLPDGGYGLLDYLFSTSATLERGYERVCQFARVVYDGSDLRLAREPDQLRLTRSTIPGARQHDEFLLALLVLRGRRATGLRWRPTVVRFRHSGAAHDELRHMFRCEPGFDAPTLELAFDSSLGARPLRRADSQLHGVLSDYARLLLDKVPSSRDPLGDVRAAVVADFADGLPTLATVARAFKVTPRTLQRRLSARGTSYQQLVDDVRRTLALEYVANASVSIGEVAFLVHYADVAAFGRAFKRWTGTGPRAYREQLWTNRSRLSPRATTTLRAR